MFFFEVGYFVFHPRSSYIMSFPQVSFNSFATVSIVSFFGPIRYMPDVLKFKILDM